jgi:ribosome-binding factor A
MAGGKGIRGGDAAGPHGGPDGARDQGRTRQARPRYLRAMDSVRQNKVNSLLQQELAEVIQGHSREFLPGGLITVTAVRVSPDLGIAKVYLSLFPVKDKKAVLERVKDRGHRLRGELGNRVGKQLRIVPELNFYIDDSLDRAEEIDQLLKK